MIKMGVSTVVNRISASASASFEGGCRELGGRDSVYGICARVSACHPAGFGISSSSPATSQNSSRLSHGRTSSSNILSSLPPLSSSEESFWRMNSARLTDQVEPAATLTFCKGRRKEMFQIFYKDFLTQLSMFHTIFPLIRDLAATLGFFLI